MILLHPASDEVEQRVMRTNKTSPYNVAVQPYKSGRMSAENN
jgi:hypothetical protein